MRVEKKNRPKPESWAWRGEGRRAERLPGVDLWGSFREGGRREERQAGERIFEFCCALWRSFPLGIFSKNCSKDVNCLSITIYLNVIRRWGKAQGDKAASGSCLHPEDLGNCLWLCLGWLDLTEGWVLCPFIRLLSLSAPFLSLHHPASCESPFWSDQLKEVKAVPSVRERLQQLSLYVTPELCERAEARKDNGGDRNYVKNSCISLHLVQGEVRMFIKSIWSESKYLKSFRLSLVGP